MTPPARHLAAIRRPRALAVGAVAVVVAVSGVTIAVTHTSDDARMPSAAGASSASSPAPTASTTPPSATPTATPTPTRSATPTRTPTRTAAPTRTTKPPTSKPRTTTPGSTGGYGVPAGTALRASGSLTLSRAGQVVSGLDVTGCITVRANNVTIRNTRVRGTCEVIVDNRATGLVLDHVEIDGRGSPSTLGIGHDSFTARNVYVHGVGDGMRANGNVLVTGSRITDLASGGGSHNDGIQITQGRSIRIIGNVIENRHAQTSAIMIGADQGSIASVLVQGNTLSGGGYTLYGGAEPPAGNTISGIVLSGNRFSRKYFPSSGAYGPLTATNDARISVSGNVWADTGRPVS